MTTSASADRLLDTAVVRNGCRHTGKIGFLTEAAAGREAARLNTKPWPAKGPRRPASHYRCSGCSRWHVGRLRT